MLWKQKYQIGDGIDDKSVNFFYINFSCKYCQIGLLIYQSFLQYFLQVFFALQIQFIEIS